MKPTSPFLFLSLMLLGVASLHTPSGSSKRALPLTLTQTYCTGSAPCVLTYHNDNNRDGVNPNESVLEASTLSTANPEPQWMAVTDGQMYAQPLYVHQLLVNGAAKNVVFGATENNSVYAWDADSGSSTGSVLTKVSLNDSSDLSSGSSEIAVPYTDWPQCGAPSIQPEVGITGTPVIDVSVTPPVMYVVSKHEDVDSGGNKTYRQKLHALAVDTLQEMPGSPVILDATFATNNAKGFNANSNLQRAGLALVHAGTSSKIWVSWASHCDNGVHNGFEIEFTYNYSGTPGFTNVYNVFNTESACTNQPCIGGIWMGGAAPAADASGNIYFAVGNGSDKFQGSGSYSNSVVKLNDSGLQDFYSPPDYDALNRGHGTVACTNPNPPKCPSPCALDTTGHYCQLTLTNGDLDLGSGGVVLLSPTFTLKNPELLAAGKQGIIYVGYANSLGHIDAQAANFAQYACTTATAPAAGSIVQCFPGLPGMANDTDRGSRGSPAFLSAVSGTTQYNYLYFVAVTDSLKAFKLQNANGVGVFNTVPAAPTSPHKFAFPGATPSVTWNQAESSQINNAIVWALDTSVPGTFGIPAGPAVLYAYRAIPSGAGSGSLGAELWDTSAYSSTIPGNPGAVKFIVPTIADGKIFVGGGAQHYEPNTATCLAPSLTTQPTACGALTMYK